MWGLKICHWGNTCVSPETVLRVKRKERLHLGSWGGRFMIFGKVGMSREGCGKLYEYM